MYGILISTLKESLLITVFVLLMMVVIEYINVQTKNYWADKLKDSPFLQIVVAAFLGITPGCLGAFTVVSLYTHRMIGLAGLVAVMIATSGDGAFVMFALFPGKAFLLNGILFLLAIGVGWVVHLITKKKDTLSPHGFIIHEKEYCRCFNTQIILPQLKNITFERAVLLLSTVMLIVLFSMGVIGPEAWNWMRITLIVGLAFLLFVFLTVPEHFLKEHLYGHVLKKHLLRIFLWTWGAFILLYFIQSNLALTNLMQNNIYLILLFAVLIGLIPDSGPQMIFVTLFSQSLLPFSILLANSIVQDGHGMLPLFAESKKDFVRVKLINMVVGLLVGLLLLQFNGL